MATNDINEIPNFTDEKKIVSDLKILATITPGKTLSTSTMTIIDHKAWSSSFWRTYSGENRKMTIFSIKKIFLQALSIIESYESCELLEHIKLALIGVSNLKETYKNDYYTISDIDHMLNEIEEEVVKCERKIGDSVIEILISKLDEDEKKNLINDNTPDLKKMVEIPNTENDSRSIENTIDSIFTNDITENNNKSTNIDQSDADLLRKIIISTSEDTTKNIITVSNIATNNIINEADNFLKKKDSKLNDIKTKLHQIESNRELELNNIESESNNIELESNNIELRLDDNKELELDYEIESNNIEPESNDIELQLDNNIKLESNDIESESDNIEAESNNIKLELDDNKELESNDIELDYEIESNQIKSNGEYFELENIRIDKIESNGNISAEYIKKNLYQEKKESYDSQDRYKSIQMETILQYNSTENRENDLYFNRNHDMSILHDIETSDRIYGTYEKNVNEFIENDSDEKTVELSIIQLAKAFRQWIDTSEDKDEYN